MYRLPQCVALAEMHHLSAMMMMVLPLALLLMMLMLRLASRIPSWPHLLLDDPDTIRKCPCRGPDPPRS